MAITLVGIGSAGNDGTGDTARTSFNKINRNFTDAENAASKLVATTAQAKAGTAGVLPDAAGVHAAFNRYGLGGAADLRSTVYSTGIPSDLYSKGTAFGFADGQQLGIPGFSAGYYGTLEVGYQWVDASGLASVYRRFTTGASGYPREFLQLAISPTTWSQWVELFHTGNIVGTVSQSGGIPTGAIIESGGNSNGEYVRYANGTQICTSALLYNGSVDSPIGSVFRTGEITWTFPIPFIASPNTSGIERAGIGNCWVARGDTGGESGSVAHYRIYRAESQSGAPQATFTAIGRWY